MEQLKQYIDDLWKHAPNSSACLDFKEELLSNCIERYQDLIDSGVPSEKAYEIVIDSIGDVDQLWKDFSLPEEKLEQNLALWRGKRSFIYPHFHAQLANKQHLDLYGITKIKITYCSEEIRILRSDSDKLILEEYFSYWDEKTLATIVREGNVLKIHYGERPLITAISFNSNVIVYLPDSYHGELEIENISGTIRTNLHLILDSLSVKSMSGSLRFCELSSAHGISLETASGAIIVGNAKLKEMLYLKSISGKIQTGQVLAERLNIRTESGRIRMEGAYCMEIRARTISGHINIEKYRGKLDISSISGTVRVFGDGYGKVSSTSGSVNLDFQEVQGDIEAKSISGSVNLVIPEFLSFLFRASTASGTVNTPFENRLNFNRRGSKAEGKVGSTPTFSIDLSSVSGSIHVNQ